MDPYNEEKRNKVQNSVYRTAMKLRATQTLCQLHLVGVPLIQLVLQSHRLHMLRQGCLDTPLLTDLLTELFHCARWEKPGQLDARAPQLTLSLLSAMYDKKGTGLLLLRSAGAALITLAGDGLTTKYRALFQLFADSHSIGSSPAAQLTRNSLKNLLTDLQQLPAAVGESLPPGCVDTAVRSCFHGVSSPGIGEEKFLSWLCSEPYILLWLSTCHRLSFTETVTHHVRCGVCKEFPITGIRYQCLKCLNLDLCQACFLTGGDSKQHKRTHPVVEHLVQQVAAKDNTKSFIRKFRNNLLRVQGQRKEAQTRKDHSERENRFKAPQVLPSSSRGLASQGPAHSGRTGSDVLEPPSCDPKSKAQQTERENKSPLESAIPRQVIVSIKEELLRTRESIKALQSERRLLRKQLHRWTDKVQFLHESQGERTMRLEAKMKDLADNNDWLQAELQRLRQAMQAMLQRPRHPSGRLGEAVEPNKSSSPQALLCKQRASHETMETNLNSEKEWQGLSPSNSDIKPLLATQIGHSVMNAMKTGVNGPKMVAREGSQNSGSGHHFEKCQLAQLESDNMKNTTSLTSSGPSGLTAETTLVKERDEEEGEENKAEAELHQLVAKLKDAMSLQVQAGHPCDMKQDLLNAAGHVSMVFSELIHQAAQHAGNSMRPLKHF